MGLVTLLYSFANGTPNDGPQVRANDDAIVAAVNGGLTAINLSPSAAIPGSYLSGTPGQRVNTAQLDDNAVDSTKLKSDAAVDGNRAVTTNHIQDGNVTKGKLSTVGGLRVTAAQIELLSGQGSIPATNAVRSYPSGTTSGGSTAFFSGVSVVPTVVAGNYQFRVLANAYRNGSGGADTVLLYDAMIDPGTIGIGAIASATYLVLNAWLSAAALDGGNHLTGSLFVAYLKLT